MNGMAQLGDFGSVRQVAATSEKTIKVGTIPCWPPEKLIKPLIHDTSTDIWTLGMVLYQLLSGLKNPFDADYNSDVAIYLAIQDDNKNPLPSSISPEVADLTWSMLNKVPTARPTIV
jgi:serine/threonine protein kinase